MRCFKAVHLCESSVEKEHTYTHIQRVWNRQFLQGEALREQKAQGLLLALEELTVHLFINVSEARLVFNSRKRDRDTREKMVMVVLYDFFFHVKHGSSFSVLDFWMDFLLSRDWLCRSHYQTFGGTSESTSEYKSLSIPLLSPPCFSLPSCCTDCMQN